MASWSFTCKNCGHPIEQSKIPDTLWNYFFPVKPDLPGGGVSKKCPNCLEIFTYTSHDLIYQMGTRFGVAG
jgi:hypothetical protein